MAGRYYTALGYTDEVTIENYLMLDINNSFSSQVEDWIAGAEKQINNYLGYTTASGILNEQISNETTKAFVDSALNLKIFPRKLPINSVTGITLNKGTTSLALTLTDSAGTAKYNIPATNNYISFPNYEMAVNGSSIINSFASLRGTEFYVKTSYIAGYTEVPADIRLAATMLASEHILRQTNKEGLQQITQGQVTKIWASRKGGESDYIKDAFSLLKPYRLVGQFI